MITEPPGDPTVRQARPAEEPATPHTHLVDEPIAPHAQLVDELAARQAALVAALVAGGPMPAGFDADRLAATRRALLRKRAAEAAKVWPLLAASLGPGWPQRFAEHADGRDRLGALRDGWDLARILRGRGELSEGAVVELAEREAAMRYDGATDPRPRAGLRRLLSRVRYRR